MDSSTNKAEDAIQSYAAGIGVQGFGGGGKWDWGVRGYTLQKVIYREMTRWPLVNSLNVANLSQQNSKITI